VAYVLTAGGRRSANLAALPGAVAISSVPRDRRRRSPFPTTAAQGLGATPTQLVGTGGSLAAPVVTAVAAPAVASALGISAAVAVPIVGAAFAGILFGVEAILNSGCGQSCVMTSEWANQAEPLLKQNIAKYFSIGARTEMDRQSALNMFDAVWSGLVQRCSQAGLSTAGKNCIEDRRAGACKWHATENSPYAGGPRQGECWNWFNAYRDPIARDTNVGSSDFAALFGSAAGGGSGVDLLPLMLIGGLVALGVML
jgi:hypothetical protein